MNKESKTTETNANDSNLSSSQKKRLDRKKKNAKVKSEALIGNLVWIAVVVIVVAGILFGIGSAVSKRSEVITPNDNFGANLDSNGYIKGVKASDVVTLPEDYESISIAAKDIEYTDAEFEEEKTKQLSSHKVLNPDSKEAVKDGDKVNIDYVGSVDGVEFEGGNSHGNGSDLTIGSGMFIDDFEQQVIGHKVGDEFDVEVTFPDNYNASELAGQDAVFKVTLNGIYEDGTFDDAFVAENLKAYADTVDGYRQYLKEKTEKERLDTAVKEYLLDKTTIEKYPAKYLKTLKSTKKYSDQESYKYMNEMYKSYYGTGYGSFEEYTGKSEEEYDASLDETCKTEEKQLLLCQAIAEKQGFTIDEDQLKADFIEEYGEENYNEQLDKYGIGYFKQKKIGEMALEYCVNNAKVQ